MGTLQKKIHGATPQFISHDLGFIKLCPGAVKPLVETIFWAITYTERTYWNISFQVQIKHSPTNAISNFQIVEAIFIVLYISCFKKKIKRAKWRTGKASKSEHSPILLLQLGEQLHIIGAEVRRRGWGEGGRGERRGRGGGGGGLQGRGCGYLASHLTDSVWHRVLHPWESRTQLTSNLVCRHLPTDRKYLLIPSEPLSNKVRLVNVLL